ncbi:MAG: hypothetical protein Q4A28_08375 [Brachymonas sp.]|nr:hypothetical protein [Brachymonas sp.]
MNECNSNLTIHESKKFKLILENQETTKIGGFGSLKYNLFIDENGATFVQITHNSESGEFPELLFPVSKYAFNAKNNIKISQTRGYKQSTNRWHESENTNTDAFLRAVIKNLLPN